MNLPETSTQLIAREEHEILLLPQLESFSERDESLNVLLAAGEATNTADKQSSGLRVLRASPIMLALCGIVFVSLIFLMDLTALRPNRAATVSRTSSASPAESVILPKNTARDQKDLANAPVVAANAPAPQPSAATPATQSPSVQPASPAPATDQTAMQQPAIASATSTNNNPKPAQANAPLAADAAGEGGFTLQVGSFNNLAEADGRVAKLSALGVNAYAVRVEIPKRGTWYRVQVGRFMNREEAGRYGAQLRGKGAVADFIVTERRAS
ncbi:MAG TPA: SPOR domain-containing protein [Pyrinomonadaceae bacterium]|jgi:cell division septation protein DedD|nr:SPOR domain-containing protein [Pyrinomonadaceae bacterium]